jgi:hypothetical protein
MTAQACYLAATRAAARREFLRGQTDRCQGLTDYEKFSTGARLRVGRPDRSWQRFPRQHQMIEPVGTAPDHPPRPDARLDRCGGLRQCKQPIAVEKPQQPVTIDPRERTFPVTPKQIERPPSECRSLPSPSIIEEPAAIIDVLPPSLRRHASRWAAGIKPGETLRPSARNPSAVFDKGRTFRIIIGPARAIRSDIVLIGTTGPNDSGDGTPIRRGLSRVPVGVIVELRNRAFRRALFGKSRVANSAISALCSEPGAAELRRLARRESGRVCQRVLMIANMLEGMEHGEAARLAGLSRSAGYEWHTRYEEDGIEGLRDRPRPGRQPRVEAATSARSRNGLSQAPSCSGTG